MLETLQNSADDNICLAGILVPLLAALMALQLKHDARAARKVTRFK